MEWIIYVLLGSVAGLLSGLLGIGGGIIVVPGLLAVFQHSVLFSTQPCLHMASATSLAAMIATASSSAYAYHRRDMLVWPVFWRMLPGLVFGLVSGSCLVTRLSNQLLEYLFALFLLGIALQIVFNKKFRFSTTVSPTVWLVSVSVGVGILTQLFGVGGGLLLVPLFLALSLNMHQASGTSSLCGVLVASMGTLISVRFVYWPAALTVGLSSILCAPLGARLSFILPIALLRRCFAGMLILSICNLVIRS